MELEPALADSEAARALYPDPRHPFAHDEAAARKFTQICTMLSQKPDDRGAADAGAHRRLLDEIHRFVRDDTWRPKPRLGIVTLLYFFMALPDDIQEAIFEESFAFIPFISSMVLPEHTLDESRKYAAGVILSVTLAGLGLLYLVFWLLVVAYQILDRRFHIFGGLGGILHIPSKIDVFESTSPKFRKRASSTSRPPPIPE